MKIVPILQSSSAQREAKFWAASIFFLACCAAWGTHVAWIIRALASDKGATVGQMVLGGIGAFFPPVGVVHGVMIWFGI